MARGTKWTPRRRNYFIEAIELGAPRITACRYAGISQSLLAKWLKLGLAAIEAGNTEDEYAIFYEEVERASSTPVMKSLRALNNAIEKDSQTAAMWMLERVVPEFRKSSTMEVVGAGGGPIIVTQVAIEPILTRPQDVIEGQVIPALPAGED